MGWVLFAVRVVPTLIGLIQGAEQRFPGPGRGEEKKKDVLDIIEKVVPPAVPEAVDEDAMRRAVSVTVDAVVAWLAVVRR